MSIAIKALPHELAEVAGLLNDTLGIVLPDDADEQTFIRDLLTALKTRAASTRMADARRQAERGNPDSPRRGERESEASQARRVRKGKLSKAERDLIYQFSAAGDSLHPPVDEAERARRFVDQQEAFHRSPNVERAPV